MADVQVKEDFKHLILTTDDELPQKTKGGVAKDNGAKQKKQKLPTDEYGSGTEEMKDDDFPRGKTGNYHSDHSDSDGTQPLEKDELMVPPSLSTVELSLFFRFFSSFFPLVNLAKI